MPISGLMVKVKLVVNIEKFKIMDYKKLLGGYNQCHSPTDCFKQQEGNKCRSMLRDTKSGNQGRLSFSNFQGPACLFLHRKVLGQYR